MVATPTANGCSPLARSTRRLTSSISAVVCSTAPRCRKVSVTSELSRAACGGRGSGSSAPARPRCCCNRSGWARASHGYGVVRNRYKYPKVLYKARLTACNSLPTKAVTFGFSPPKDPSESSTSYPDSRLIKSATPSLLSPRDTTGNTISAPTVADSSSMITPRDTSTTTQPATAMPSSPQTISSTWPPTAQDLSG